MKHIKVWEFNGYSWNQTYTNFLEETTDEYNFFRVIKDNTKEYYWKASDYISRNEINYDIYNIKNELLKKF